MFFAILAVDFFARILNFEEWMQKLPLAVSAALIACIAGSKYLLFAIAA